MVRTREGFLQQDVKRKEIKGNMDQFDYLKLVIFVHQELQKRKWQGKPGLRKRYLQHTHILHESCGRGIGKELQESIKQKATIQQEHREKTPMDSLLERQRLVTVAGMSPVHGVLHSGAPI